VDVNVPLGSAQHPVLVPVGLAYSEHRSS
jgi:hypothetical protein